MITALLNGAKPSDTDFAVAIADRGLNYGDGLFESLLLERSRVRLLAAHLQRLATSCARLGIEYPGDAIFQKEIATISEGHSSGVIKLVVTRGVGGRGYRASRDCRPTRIVSLHEYHATAADIHVRWCDTHLSRNPALAGIKHLNRLEQVLAQREWDDSQIDEGLMLDYEGELVCATAANVFLVRNAEIVTPDLRYCGVRGVMRDHVIRVAQQLDIAVHEEPLWPDDLSTASEVFLTNAVRGVRAVLSLDAMSWTRGPVTQALCASLNQHA